MFRTNELSIGGERNERRWRNLRSVVGAAVITVGLAGATLAGNGWGDGNGNQQHWAASWATSPAAYYVYATPIPQNQALGFSTTKYATANIEADQIFPFPNVNTDGANNQTIRSIVKPDLWGRTMRVHFSNVFGNQPLSLSATTVALQDYAGNVVPGTVAQVSFGKAKSVTIPVGQEIWSDAVDLRWVDPDDPLLQGRNLAISYAIQGTSGHMTFHPLANMTSFVTPTGSGDHTKDVDGFAYEYTTTAWYFLTGLDVMAPSDTVVVCAFGELDHRRQPHDS